MKNKLSKVISTGATLASSFLIFICAHQTNAQDLISDDDGIKITNKGNLEITYDEFTGDITIEVADTLSLSNFYERELGNEKSFIMPVFFSNESDLKDDYGLDGIFSLMILNGKFETYLSEKTGNIPVHFLIDGERNSTNGLYLRPEQQKPKEEALLIKFSKEEWEQIIESEKTRLRISKQVFLLDRNTKGLMAEIFKEYKALKSDFNKKNETQGSKSSEKAKSAPYELRWEGDLKRAPMVQPLPENISDTEATIIMRFEVKPDGTMGRIIPLRKKNPKLGREVMRTLRSWRFSRLPSSIPQQSQWGTITF